VHFAEPAAYTAIFIKDFRFCILARLDDFLRTKGHADTAAFAPIIIKRDVKLFLFLRVILHRAQVLNCSISHSCETLQPAMLAVDYRQQIYTISVTLASERRLYLHLRPTKPHSRQVEIFHYSLLSFILSIIA
jgi:hypothetical protein